MTRSSLVRWLAGACAFMAAAAPAPSLASGRAGWVHGWVQDASGLRIAGAQVRVEATAGERQVSTATTGTSGEFSLAGLAPGLYILTAHKEGYAASTSRLNTLIDSRIAMTLSPVLGEVRPGEEPGPAAPAGPGWVLRQPRGDLLRQQGLVASSAERLPAGPVAASQARFHTDFQHLLELGSGARAGGRAMQLDVGSEPGTEARVALSASSEKRFAQSEASSAAPRKEHDWRRAELGARFEPRPGDSVELSARVEEHTYATGERGAAQQTGFDQEVSGYAARWERSFGGVGSIDVAFGYRAAEVDADDQADSDPTQSEIWQAAGSYKVEIGDRRQMEVDVRARRLQVDSPGALPVSIFDEDGGLPGAGAQGAWALDLSGREQRALRGPLSLDYGFSYHRRAEDLSTSDAADAFIPEAGVTVQQADGPRWSAGISLALDRPGAGGSESPAEPAADGSDMLSRFGYRLSMDYPLERLGLNVAVNATYHPYAYAPLGDEAAPLEISTPLRRSLMISEGNAESREVGVRLEKRFRGFVGALGSQVGQVEGYLMTGYFDEVPVQQVSYNLVRYMVASARGYRPGSGTLVHVDYQRFLNNPKQAFDPASLSYLYERLDLALEQDLPFVDFWDARWRLLVALQNLRTDALRGDDLQSLRQAGVRESERRLSGGLAIRF